MTVRETHEVPGSPAVLRFAFFWSSSTRISSRRLQSSLLFPILPLSTHAFHSQTRLTAVFQTAPSRPELFTATRIVSDAVCIAFSPHPPSLRRLRSQLFPAPPQAGKFGPPFLSSSNPLYHTFGQPSPFQPRPLILRPTCFLSPHSERHQRPQHR